MTHSRNPYHIAHEVVQDIAIACIPAQAERTTADALLWYLGTGRASLAWCEALIAKVQDKRQINALIRRTRACGTRDEVIRVATAYIAQQQRRKA